MTRVGFIGLGDQGGGMAQRLIECGFPTTLWARREASLEAFRTTAATYAATPVELGAASDIVGICVVDDAGVEDVLLGDQGVLSGMSAGSLIAIHSTVSLALCAKVAAAAAAQGVSVIDAPVSGGGVAAAQGELTVMVGGASDTVERARPVLSTFGRHVFHLGPLGSGLLTKLVNNTLHAAHYALAHDAIAAGAALGIEGRALGETLAVSSGASTSLGVMVSAGGLEPLSPFVGSLLKKDVGIFAAVLAEHDVSPGMLVDVADVALGHFGHARDH